MQLRLLLKALPEYELRGDSNLEIAGICYDSRKVKPGCLFAALPGQKSHGLEFLSEAIANGAAAILADWPIESALPTILVSETRRSMALISNRFYGEPSRKLKLVGITGTNGKTTISYLIRSIFETAGTLCGLVGSILYDGDQFTKQSAMTTPESVDLQELLIRFLNEGSGACSMEASSQGLDQHRVRGCTFEAAIFTNLTQDHLDYHKTMERYFQAKQMLFDPKYCDSRIAVINQDDEYGERILSSRKADNLASVSYGFRKEAEYRITFWKSTINGTDIIVHHGNMDQKIRTPLIGKYNVYNVTAAYTAADAIGLERDAVLSGIEQMTFIPGRLEKLELGQPFHIILDYAHTEDAFRQLLPSLRLFTTGRLIHIFGCRGERDKTKRSLMGKASGELADEIVLTSDNPVYEDPEQIAREIKAGIDLSGNTNVHILLDRGEAIARAVSLAKTGDTIVITGKGNETYQLIQDKKIHFDEREYFKSALENR